MTLRSELEKVLGPNAWVKDMDVFLREHGQALLDAVADSERLNWADANPFMAYRDRDAGDGSLQSHVTVVAEDKVPRRGNVRHSIREAIDAARGDA